MDLEKLRLSAGDLDVIRERCRQIEAEGFGDSNDDQYRDCVLSMAAQCYIGHSRMPERHLHPETTRPIGWPFPPGWWKPSQDRRRDLVKAAALILAEIDRLDRQETKGPTPIKMRFDFVDQDHGRG